MNENLIKHTLESNRNPRYGYHKVEGYDTLFSLNNEMRDMGKSFGIIYSVEEDFKTLHKHGRFEEIKELYQERYEKIDFFNFKLLEVPVEDYLWINTIINISASNWIDRLISHLETFDVEVIEKEDNE